MSAPDQRRIDVCVNACAGIKDPENTIRELIVLLYDYEAMFETYAMQDMSPEILQGELQSDVFNKVIKQRKRIYATLAKLPLEDE